MTDLATEVTRVMGLPVAVTLHFCPHCGRRVTGSYNIDESRKKCSKLWHKSSPRAVRYVREDRQCDPKPPETLSHKAEDSDD